MYIHFPKFNPIICSIGPFSAHWYGFMYVISFIFAIIYGKKLIKKKQKNSSGIIFIYYFFRFLHRW